MDAKSKLDRLDDYQQHHRVAAIAIATFKKFGEDKSTNLASMVAFWAIFSIFPLFLAGVTILGFVLPSGTKANVLDHVAKLFPLLNVQTVKGLSGSWWALIVGVVSALWSGSGVIRTTQFAFNSVWEIPYHERPNTVEQVLRSLWVLATIGAGLVVSTIISGYVSGSSSVVDIGPLARVAGYVISILLDVGLFVAAFRLLTDRDISTRDVLPGAALSGIVFFVLQAVSSIIISRYLHKAQGTYGNFATVITILWWFYLQGILTMLGAQLNVVLKERLWPRGLVNAPDTEADHRAYQAYAAERTYHEEEQVDTKFEGTDDRSGKPGG